MRKINISPMNYSSLLNKLHVGVALADRGQKAKDITKFNQSNEEQLLSSAIRTGQVDPKYLAGFGQTDLLAQAQSGDFLPDTLWGWSTKTILAGLSILLILKLKKVQR